MNKQHRFLALAVGLYVAGALTGPAAAQTNFAGLIRVPPITAPAMDKQWIGATEWQAADQVAGWADSILGAANGDGTLVALGHAAGVLYVRFTCPIPEKFRLNKVWYASAPLKTTVAQKDGDILQDDYAGVYLRPPGSADIYFLGVNGAGVTRDSRNGDVSWNGQWQTQQTRDDNFWTVGFAIPLNQLGGTVTEDQAWGINFAHGARNIELLESIWAYQPAELNPMAEMRLSSRAIAVALAGFGSLAEGSFALKGQINNLSKEPFDGALTVAVRGMDETNKPVFGPANISLSLKPGEKKDIAANFDAGSPLCGTASVTVKDAQGTVLLDYGLPFVFAREISLETRWIPTPSILQVVLDLGSPASFKKVTAGKVKITSLESKKEALTQALPAFQSSLSISDIDCGKLPPGRYEAEVELKLGSVTSVLKDSFVKEPNPEWLGNTVGISDKVPIPWTPLKVNDDKGALKVSCWGRQYTFGPAGFPSQINVLGQDILAGPVRVLVKRNGKTEVLPAGACQITGTKDARVSFKSVAKAGGVEIAVEAWMEFDGFVWNTIKVQSDTPAEIEGLSVEIPLKKEYATLWWHSTLGWNTLYTDKMGAPPNQAYASEPLNFLRLGDEEHGFQFFFESLKNWNPAPGKGQELIPGEKEYVLRYNIIGQTTKLDKPLEIELGYMALPCRPRSNLFRRIDVESMWSGLPVFSKQQTEQANWIFQIKPLFSSGWYGQRPDCNYFNFWNTEVYDKDFLQKLKEKTILPAWETNANAFCLYYQGGTTDANTPEYRKYRFEWKITPGSATYIPPDPKTRDKPIMAGVCHHSRSYVDFQVWYMDKTLRYLSDNGKIPIHGYQDCNGYGMCMNSLHGCPPEGQTPILADREFVKRVYTIYKTLNPLNQLYVHSGGNSIMNIHGFFDVMIEGEQYSSSYSALMVQDPSLQKNYTKIFNLDRYRAQCQPYAWGPDRYLLWQFWGWCTNDPDEARGARGHLWGLSFCHDAPVIWCGVPACVPRAIGELKWDDQVEFIPYWRKQTGIEVKAPVSPVVVSAWRRGNGNLLAIVFNDSDQTAASRLNIDFARFGFKPGEIKCRDYGGYGLGYPDALYTYQFKEKKVVDPQQLTVQDSVVKAGADLPVEVKQRSFKLLRFYQ